MGFSRLAQLYVYECKEKFSSQYSAIFIEVILSYLPSAQSIYLKADSPDELTQVE
ncbi:hypothetical protein NDI35_12055 [Microcoleus vaginatus FACHB-2002]